MAATITWTVTAMDCYPQVDNKTDVVFNVHWICSGTQDTYTSSIYSTQSVTLDSSATYTPYDQLTEAQILSWIWASGVDKTATETSVQQQIDNQINPPVVTPPLPWASQEA